MHRNEPKTIGVRVERQIDTRVTVLFGKPMAVSCPEMLHTVAGSPSSPQSFTQMNRPPLRTSRRSS